MNNIVEQAKGKPVCVSVSLSLSQSCAPPPSSLPLLPSSCRLLLMSMVTPCVCPFHSLGLTRSELCLNQSMVPELSPEKCISKANRDSLRFYGTVLGKYQYDATNRFHRQQCWFHNLFIAFSLCPSVRAEIAYYCSGGGKFCW